MGIGFTNIRRSILLWVTIGWYVLGLVSAVFGQTLSVYYKRDRNRRRSVNIISQGQVQYVSLQDLAELFHVKTYYSHKAKKISLSLGARELKVTAFNPFVMVDNEIYQLPIDTRYWDGEIFVPLRSFVELLKRIFPGKIRLDEERRYLEISPLSDANIIDVNIEEKDNGTLIRISTTRIFRPSEVSTRIRRGWLYVDIYGGKVDSTHLYSNFRRGAVKEVVPLQLSEEMAQIGFKLTKKVTKREAYISETSGEILVSLRTKEELSADILSRLEKARKKWLIDRVVIDPGHGGKDPGAIGPTGVQEKVVTLGIAKDLKKLLEWRLGVKVIMTRERDEFVPIEERTALANRMEGKLFISIHTNSNRNRRVRGCSTYILGPANTEEAREVALRENSVIKYEDNSRKYKDLSNENFILSAMAQNQYQYESQELGAIVQREMAEKLDITGRGVKQAGYYVLIGASMPNILVETAFISNPTEERLLASRRFQKKVAEALFESIKKFKSRYERGI